MTMESNRQFLGDMQTAKLQCPRTFCLAPEVIQKHINYSSTITVPEVGQLVFLDRHVPDDLGIFYLDEVQEILPDNVRFPTLKEDLMILTHVHPFAQLLATQIPENLRFYFENREYTNLVTLASRMHFVGTQIKDLEQATREDFEREVTSQGLDPQSYSKLWSAIYSEVEQMFRGHDWGAVPYSERDFPKGAMATILENGEEKDRIYISDGMAPMVFHPKYGTPLVSFITIPSSLDYPDMEASGFSKGYRDRKIDDVAMMVFGNLNTLGHLVNNYPKDKAMTIASMGGRVFFRHGSLKENWDREVTLSMNQSDGFYLIYKQ